MAITIKARTDFVRNISKLSLWLAQKYSIQNIPFEKALSKGTPLYRLTVLWDGMHHPAAGWDDEQWNHLTDRLKRLFSGELNSAQAEKQGLKILWPYLEPRIERDVQEWPWIPSAFGTKKMEERVYGFFLYEIIEDGKTIDLHMGNPYAPHSPFENMKQMEADLKDLLEGVITVNTGVENIVCESWLNSFKPFCSLFPLEWCENSVKTDMFNYTYDIWGQMMNRHGAYHLRNGDLLRKTGEFPFASIKCGCKIDSLFKHLRNSNIK